MTRTLSPRATISTRPAPLLALSDCMVLIGRNLRHVLRNTDQVIQAIALPAILLLLFRYLFGGAIDTGDVVYVNYLIAGLLVISVAFNSTSTAVGVAGDLRNGIVERFRSMPMLGQAVLVGHMVAGVLRNLLSTVILVGLGLVVGFRPTAGLGGWLAGLGVLLVFMVGVSVLAVLLGLVAGSVEGAAGLSMIMVFLPYASSALVPAESMPAGLRFFVENQPVTPVIDAVRALLLDMPVGGSAVVALAWWVGIGLLAGTFAARRFRTRTTH